MDLGFYPYSKTEQLKSHQKDKQRPKFKPRKPKKPKKKLETYKGRTIPTKKSRGKISTSDYKKAQEEHGDYCYLCRTTSNLEAHHVKFRSAGGRGKFRNIRFLCSECHRGNNGPHHKAEIREQLEQLHESLYGPYYHHDRFDLYKLGLIPNTTKQAYENFFKEWEHDGAKGSGT